jgi:hypothetical protein
VGRRGGFDSPALAARGGGERGMRGSFGAALGGGREAADLADDDVEELAVANGARGAGSLGHGSSS